MTLPTMSAFRPDEDNVTRKSKVHYRRVVLLGQSKEMPGRGHRHRHAFCQLSPVVAGNSCPVRAQVVLGRLAQVVP